MKAELISTVFCEDVLRNVSGNLSLYVIFPTIVSEVFPASFRIAVVNTWKGEGRCEERVVLLSPDGDSVLSEANSSFLLREGVLHTQISLFEEIVFVEEGTYRIEVWLGGVKRSELPLLVKRISTKVT